MQPAERLAIFSLLLYIYIYINTAAGEQNIAATWSSLLVVVMTTTRREDHVTLNTAFLAEIYRMHFKIRILFYKETRSMSLNICYYWFLHSHPFQVLPSVGS
ncbi:hypothetical protein AMECASPLE_038526 [Ameca splendens]|uniref:Secreted protein n=1 Tax=Ameca splendens TaxID=208324 RepID=A0ABV0XXA3_9TELE